ncbi:hypothetical protein COV18_02790 [Candidatus Woesearchaeota archaeon CG10_big_fil_rev_8_21_14_0_10_37_12]|nr:MAG: hypothetical protein COV18_02790 [Candidatus Woesearchaeota archaeon CG10_big_fil_rev_8_21_14_0_10_37_12]
MKLKLALLLIGFSLLAGMVNAQTGNQFTFTPSSTLINVTAGGTFSFNITITGNATVETSGTVAINISQLNTSGSVQNVISFTNATSTHDLFTGSQSGNVVVLGLVPTSDVNFSIVTVNFTLNYSVPFAATAGNYTLVLTNETVADSGGTPLSINSFGLLDTSISSNITINVSAGSINDSLTKYCTINPSTIAQGENFSVSYLIVHTASGTAGGNVGGVFEQNTYNTTAFNVTAAAASNASYVFQNSTLNNSPITTSLTTLTQPIVNTNGTATLYSINFTSSNTTTNVGAYQFGIIETTLEATNSTNSPINDTAVENCTLTVTTPSSGSTGTTQSGGSNTATSYYTALKNAAGICNVCAGISGDTTYSCCSWTSLGSRLYCQRLGEELANNSNNILNQGICKVEPTTQLPVTVLPQRSEPRAPVGQATTTTQTIAAEKPAPKAEIPTPQKTKEQITFESQNNLPKLIGIALFLILLAATIAGAVYRRSHPPGNETYNPTHLPTTLSHMWPFRH